MQSMIGDSVQGKDGNVETTAFAKKGHVVGLYFSAHWCPPCRGFTPKLAEWYKNFKADANNANKDKLEIVFVSSDRDQASFDDYYKEMPWLALPYDKRDEKNALSKKFGVRGIPSFVFVEADTGKLITKSGRDVVSSDPKGQKFPWKPKTLSQILQGPVKAKDGDALVDKDLQSMIEGKILAIYFSAHWCPPCKAFTPELAKTYTKLKEAGKNFEILFASSDRDEASWASYFKESHGPWLSLPFSDDGEDDQRKNELDAHFEVDGIPSLIILDEDRNVINADGRSAVSNDPEGAKFPWVPPPLLPITDAISGIQENHCLCYLTGAEDDADGAKQKVLVANAVECMEAVAKEVKEETAAGKDAITLCYEADDGSNRELAGNLRRFLGNEAITTHLMYLNMSDNQKKVFTQETYTQADIRAIVASIRDGSITNDCTPLK